ncbi:hypothetical protein FBU30_008780 [Linnemannia zychae]|nr:hypothetical protein FBU30_008780 [Linnemannia zychae]
MRQKFLTFGFEILQKYGQYIQRVLNISSFSLVKLLQHPNINCVKIVSAVNLKDCHERALEYDFIRRNSAVMTDLTFHGPNNGSDSPEMMYGNDCFQFEPNILIPLPVNTSNKSLVTKSQLARLELTRLCLSYEGFISLLRNAPSLQDLTLFKVTVFFHGYQDFPIFYDSSVTTLTATLAEICSPGSGATGLTPNLLRNFPRLETWNMTAVEPPYAWYNDSSLRDDLRKWCPHMKSIVFKHFRDTERLPSLLLNSICQPKSCTFSAKNLCGDMVLSLDSHFNSLTSIIIIDECVSDNMLKWVYQIPKLCPHLKVLSMKEMVLRLSTVKEHTWACQDLETLHVQFKELGASQEIHGSLKRLRYLRQQLGIPNSAVTDPIYFQVASYLFKFSKLTFIWLGTETYYIPVASVLYGPRIRGSGLVCR